MSLFFFHLRTDRELETDDIGTSFPDLESAYLDVCRAIPEMVHDLLQTDRDPMRCAFEIVDERGQALMHVPFAERLTRHVERPSAAIPTAISNAALDRVFGEAVAAKAAARDLRKAIHDTREQIAMSRRSNTPYLDLIEIYYRLQGVDLADHRSAP